MEQTNSQSVSSVSQEISQVQKNLNDLGIFLEQVEAKGQKNTYYIYNMWMAINNSSQKLDALQKNLTSVNESKLPES
jgi:hypothetical protein